MNSIEYGLFEFQRLAFFMIHTVHSVQGESKKPDTFQIQISHNLLKYRISLSYFVPWVENLVFLRSYYNRLWLIWIWKVSVFWIHPVDCTLSIFYASLCSA